MPSSAPDRLREAADPLAPGPAEPAAQTAAELRTAAQAARSTITQVLKERAALMDATDADILRLIDEAVGRVLAQLAGQPSDYQLWVLPRLIDGLTRIAEQLATEAGQKATTAMSQAWTLGMKAAESPLGIGASGAAALGTPELAQVRALQVMTTNQIKGASTAAVTAINQELGQVVLGVQSPFDAQRKVAAILTDRTSSQLRGIVGLSLGQAFNTAAFNKLKAQALRDPKIKKMWRRSGKLHARWNHDAIDGTVMDVDKPFILQPGNRKGPPIEIMYPADPAAPLSETINCGCVLIPWKATWGMLYKGAKPYTPEERAVRGLDKGKVPPKVAAAPKAQSTQDKALAAFGATPTKGATLRDVTGQQVVVDSRLIGSATAPAALLAGKQDLAAYWTVQALRRPTEVWQSERIDLTSGEVLRTREFVKRFTAAGKQWLATGMLKPDGKQWVGATPIAIIPAPPAGPGLRLGVKVWPRRA